MNFYPKYIFTIDNESFKNDEKISELIDKINVELSTIKDNDKFYYTYYEPKQIYDPIDKNIIINEILNLKLSEKYHREIMISVSEIINKHKQKVSVFYKNVYETKLNELNILYQDRGFYISTNKSNCRSMEGLDRMKNRNKYKHYNACDICAKLFTYDNLIKDKEKEIELLKKDYRYNDCFKRNYSIEHIIESIIKEISNNHIIKKMILTESNHKDRLFFGIDNCDIIISLSDIYESILMEKSKKSFEKSFENLLSNGNEKSK